ncbi:MAG: hypothetical protein HYS44_01270 [Candidatus Niyogibacteria bacterium]|nr:hypothetical protein [Candidatus Niyogibacteria bacterium]
MDAGDRHLFVQSIMTVITLGHEKMLAILQETNELSNEEARVELRGLGGIFSEVDLLGDADFMATLELAFLYECVKEKAPKEANTLIADLTALFGPVLAEKFYAAAANRVEKNMESGHPVVHHINQLTHQITSFVKNRPKSRHATFALPRHGKPVRQGVETKFVECPDCGVRKRCDASTKYFRCKCGKRPYPFQKPATA